MKIVNIFAITYKSEIHGCEIKISITVTVQQVEVFKFNMYNFTFCFLKVSKKQIGSVLAFR